jgi:hypothetical protein
MQARIFCGFVALCLAAASPAARAADDAPSDLSAKMSADAKAFAAAVKRDSKVVAKTAKDGAQQVAVSAKEIAHSVAAASKQGAHEVADAAKRGADKTKAIVKPDRTDASGKTPNSSDNKPQR